MVQTYREHMKQPATSDRSLLPLWSRQFLQTALVAGSSSSGGDGSAQQGVDDGGGWNTRSKVAAKG